MSGNKCGAVVFIMSFWAQLVPDEPLRKTVKDFLVITVSRGLPEWFQIFSQDIVAEFLVLLHPWVAKAVSHLNFLISYVMRSPPSVSVCLNYCHSQTTFSRIYNACSKTHGQQAFILIACPALCCFG